MWKMKTLALTVKKLLARLQVFLKKAELQKIKSNSKITQSKKCWYQRKGSVKL